MSYTGTQVYFPASTDFAAVRDALAAQVSSLTATAGQLLATFDNGQVIRVAHDTAAHVPEEAKELAARAEPAVAAVLAQATHRFEITPHEPDADPDDVYNELLQVFEALRALPSAVGMDPFDGQLYLDAPSTPAAKPAAKVATKRAAPAKPAKATSKKPVNAAKPAKATSKKPAHAKPAKAKAAKKSSKRTRR